MALTGISFRKTRLRTTIGCAERFGSQGKFVWPISAPWGWRARLEVVLHAAATLQSKQDVSVHFWIVGDGAIRQQLDGQSRAMGLNNVFFAGRLSKEQIPSVLASADCCLVHLKDTPLFETVIPSKIFETWGMKRNHSSWLCEERPAFGAESSGGHLYRTRHSS